MCWGFPQKISRQDRLGATISNSVDPQYPRFCPSSNTLRIFRVDRCGQRFQSGPVNPNFAGKSRWFGSASYEALRVTLVSNIEYFLALPKCVFRLAIVNRRWRQQAYAGVTVLFVVPPKKTLTESATVLDAPKAVRELRPIFQGSELALGKGIVVRHVRPAMRFRDTQIGE